MKKAISIFAVVLLGAFGLFSLAACNNPGNGLTGTVRVSGSSSISPLMSELAAAYEAAHDGAEIRITTSDSGGGIADTKSGENEIGMVSRALTDAEKADVVDTKIADDGVVVVTNPGTETANATGPELYALYVNGTAFGDITKGITREEGSGTRSAFGDLIKNADGAALGKFTGDFNTTAISQQGSAGAVKTAIAGSTGVGTVGYISLSEVDNTVKALSFGGVAPSAATIKNGTYKLSRPFNIITKKGATLSALAQDFIDFILSEDGQAIVEAEGCIAL